MEKSIKISIIIPVYKSEEYLDRCVESAVNQTYRNLEIILVDDGSPDRSPQMCDEWANRDKRIIVIHKTNGGSSSVRNFGVRVAKGDFIMYLDSDDWLELDAIECLLTEQIRTDADVVWGKALMHTPDGDVELGEPKYRNKKDWVLCYARLTQGCVMVCWRRIIRRSLYIDNNIHAIEGCNYAEDKVLMAQIAYFANSFSAIDQVVYHYNRLNSHSLTAQDRKQSFDISIFKQEMGSLLAIEHFYTDKEREFYNEFMMAKMRFLASRLEKAYDLHSPKGFKTIKGFIDNTDCSFFYTIGFDRLKNRIVYYSYYTLRLYRFIAKAVRKFKIFIL